MRSVHKRDYNWVTSRQRGKKKKKKKKFVFHGVLFIHRLFCIVPTPCLPDPLSIPFQIMYSSIIRKSENKPTDVFNNPIDWKPEDIKPRTAKPLDIFGNFSIWKIFAPKTVRQEAVVPPKPKVKDVFG